MHAIRLCMCCLCVSTFASVARRWASLSSIVRYRTVSHARILQHWPCVCMCWHPLLHFLHVTFYLHVFLWFCLHLFTMLFVLIISWSTAMSGLMFSRPLSGCIEVFSVLWHRGTLHLCWYHCMLLLTWT